MEEALEKQTKTIEDQGKQQVDPLKILKFDIQKFAIKNMIPEDILNNEAKNELDKIKEIEKSVDRENLIHRAGNNSDKNQTNCLFFLSIKRYHKKVYSDIIKSIQILKWVLYL